MAQDNKSAHDNSFSRDQARQGERFREGNRRASENLAETSRRWSDRMVGRRGNGNNR